MMYTPKFLSLDGAARLIADRLKAGDSEVCVDDQAAIESARRQLLAALYEGAVRAEGVWWEVPGGTEQPEQPEIQYDTWNLIPQGLWSHERYTEDSDGEAVRLDTVGLGWTNSSLSLYDRKDCLTEFEVHKIRVHIEDIDRAFMSPRNSLKVASSLPNLAFPGRARTFSRPLVLNEMRRRAETGALCDTVSAEARELADWVQREHPDATDRVTAKNIENIFRDEYRKLRNSMKPNPRSATTSPK